MLASAVKLEKLLAAAIEGRRHYIAPWKWQIFRPGRRPEGLQAIDADVELGGKSDEQVMSSGKPAFPISSEDFQTAALLRR